MQKILNIKKENAELEEEEEKQKDQLLNMVVKNIKHKKREFLTLRRGRETEGNKAEDKRFSRSLCKKCRKPEY